MGPLVKNCTDAVSHFFISAGRAFFFNSKQLRGFIRTMARELFFVNEKKSSELFSLLIQYM